ncbi:MAG: hypothetical protein LBO82_09105 [Synergistaceae bacterium]|nr:hypothetical protein [Synergistaceae bacterium]
MRKIRRRIVFFFVFFSLACCPIFDGRAFGEGQNPARQSPFSELPPGHWAYDAVNALTARGLIHDREPGGFQGGSLATRYDMAALLAQILNAGAAERADEEERLLVRRMIAEFRNELRALGVSAEKIEEKIGNGIDEGAGADGRLGGWQLAGSLRLDIRALEENGDGDENGDGTGSGSVRVPAARLDLVRRFGADGTHFFHMQMNDSYGRMGPELSKFYARFDMGEWRMTAGRFSMDLETDRMVYQTGRMGHYGQGAWLTDVNNDGIGFSRAFSLGRFDMYVTRDALSSELPNAWTAAARAALRFTDRFDADVGINHLAVDRGENAELESVTTLWIAPKVNLTRDVRLSGAVYFQSNSCGPNMAEAWAGENIDSSPAAWKVVLDIRQNLLKFTGVWLEYNHLDSGFVLVRGGESLVLSDIGERDFFGSLVLGGDLSVWRVGLNQIWNDKWSSWLYYAHYDFSGYPGLLGPTNPAMDEFSAGVEYRLNPHATFTLSYLLYNFNRDAFMNKNRTLLFRTALWF